ISMDLRMDRFSAGKFYSAMVFNSGSLYVNSGSLQVNSGILLVNSVDIKLRLMTVGAGEGKLTFLLLNITVRDFYGAYFYHRQALSHNPTIYDSLVKQFWQTAIVRTLANGTQQLVASIDSKEYTITEASVRSKLQLADATGINNLSDAKIYARLATLGMLLTVN
ncbi:hypothetical protein Tco_1545043, partial [Tanacetum coccineum]